MGDFLKNINWKHVLIMCIGNVFAGMGIGIFKLAGLGTDPFSGMNMAVADMIGMAYGNFQLIVNIVLLIIEIALAEVPGDRYGCECGLSGLYYYFLL